MIKYGRFCDVPVSSLMNCQNFVEKLANNFWKQDGKHYKRKERKIKSVFYKITTHLPCFWLLHRRESRTFSCYLKWDLLILSSMFTPMSGLGKLGLHQVFVGLESIEMYYSNYCNPGFPHKTLMICSQFVIQYLLTFVAFCLKLECHSILPVAFRLLRPSLFFII